jgi:hypothetical protein
MKLIFCHLSPFCLRPLDGSNTLTFPRRGALSFDIPSLSINLADAFELFESSKQARCFFMLMPVAYGAVVCLLLAICFVNQKRWHVFCALTVPQNLHIIDYSLSQTTLEQVFLSFADKQKNSDIGAALGNAGGADFTGHDAAGLVGLTAAFVPR